MLLPMKEQLKSVILPKLPIVGTLKLSTRDGTKISSIEVVKDQKASDLDPYFMSTYLELLNYLSGTSRKIHIKLDESALTPFQKNVLKVMKTIPYGKVVSYRDIAQKLNSRAYQAIGNACGKNPFLLIYPCHRVVGTNNPGGFAHGLKMKKELLKLEGFNL
jgi:O-6-methylguanine DNA methyltransferase